LTAYQKTYDNLYVFDRNSVQCDYYDNAPPSGPLAARNIAWDTAAKLGWTHFVVLDDDYGGMQIYQNWGMQYRELLINTKGEIRKVPEQWGDCLFHSLWDLLDDVPQIQCVSLSQSGDRADHIKQKVMQTFFLRTDRRFQFVARLNDDVTTYYDLGLRGEIVLQMPALQIRQWQTQKQPGGLSEDYLRYGTYAKSMYTVLRWPAHCQVDYIPSVGRIHHKIATYAYPLIIQGV